MTVHDGSLPLWAEALELVLVAPPGAVLVENYLLATTVVTGDNIVSALTGIIGKALNTSVG